MWTSYAVGLIGIAVVMAAWLAVQLAWGRTFPDASADPDVLAGRPGCNGCGSLDRCERPCQEPADRAAEENR